jgi:response regulator NasT
MVPSEHHAEIFDRVGEHGVFTLPKPTSMPLLTIALEWMAAARERLRGPEKTSLSFESKMEEIRIINRAKWQLISALGLDEPQAHRYIEKQAMDRCISKREVAEEILRTYS